ncbi:MAG: LamG-like jellyroll fold domain-containing protein [Verrucomicrobiota bacterium]
MKNLPSRCLPSSLCLCVCAVLTFSRAASAAVIFDNFDVGGGFHPQDYLTAASVNTTSSTNGVRSAAQFTVTGGNFNLTSITLPISVSSTVPGNFLRVRLTTDVVGSPGSTLEVLSENQSIWPNLSNPFTTATTVPSTTHPLLSNGAKYWIVTEPTSVPAGANAVVSYRWSDNTNGTTVPIRQESEGGLPSDPWNGYNGSNSVAFRVEGTNAVNCQPEPLLLFNTGIGTNGSALPLGSADPHFTIPINPNGGGNQAYALAAAGLTNTAVSQWIAPTPSGAGANGTYLYQISFYLPCTNEAVISGRWAADNDGAIQINNHTSPVAILTGGGSANFTTWHSFAFSSGLVAGLNTLYFYVTNNGGGTALRVELSGSAACCCPPAALALPDSGVDANNVALPPDAVDPRFSLTNNLSPGTNAVVVNNPPGAWLTNDATSQWIGPENADLFSNETYRYAYTFNLPCTNSALVSGRWAVDNNGAIFVNNQPNPVAELTGGVSANFTDWHPFAISSGLVAGKNTLYFYVTNFSNATGLRVELDGSANCCCPNVNTVSLNTGLNQAAGSVYATGQADAFWRVTADPTVPPSTLPRPATVIQGNSAWKPPQANSQWISSYPTEVNNLNGAYVFETDFCLAGDASNVVVNVCLRADDSAGVSLNGHPLALAPANTTYGAAVPACGTASMLVNPTWFLTGKNTLTVIVTNSGAVAMGLNLSGTVTGSGLIDPNSECCRPTSGISGQKYFDFNANGVRDTGEPALAGWTIHLSNGQEVVTDVNGFYYFPNLAGGVYAVTEVMQPGWTQITPASGSNVVAVGTAQQINGVNFGNWHTNDPACFQIYCPSNQVIYAAPNVPVNYTVTATNLCSTNEPILYCTPPPNSLFPVGTTTVNCTAYDLEGNHAECDFTVTVFDTTPVFTNCPASTNLGCNPVTIPDCDPNVGATNGYAGAAPAYLLVSSVNSSEVKRYNGTSGAFIDNFVTAGSGGLALPEGLAIGPDGNLYVSSLGTDEVKRYSGTTGAFIDNFVTSGSGGLSDPIGLVFGSDGNLYVVSGVTDEVKRYSGTTGAFIDSFVTSGSGGLNEPSELVFGSDGNLYVSSYGTSEVKRYTGTTGAFIDNFVTAGSGGLSRPEGLMFGSDGNLYVSSFNTDEVKRYHGTTGAFIDTFVSAGSGGLNGPVGLGFGPDGNLYVSSVGTVDVKRYNGTTGAFIDNFASGLFGSPTFLIFTPFVGVTCAKLDTTNGCAHTRTITYTATSNYGATNTCVQVITWTADTTPPVITNYPAGGDLGCNPTNLPTDVSMQALIGAVDDCGTPTINVSHVDNGSPCGMNRTFTISASDACGNISGTINVNYTWVADTNPPTLTVGSIGSCYPSVTAAQNAALNNTANSDECGSVSLTASTVGTCSAVVTVTATDVCGNSASVSYNTRIITTPPVITSIPAGTNLGCNPTNLPTDTTVRALVAATNVCGLGSTNVTHVDAGPACAKTRTFTITVQSQCGPAAVTNVVYTWSQDTQAPVVTCASNKTVECGSSWSFDPPAVADGCSGTNVALTYATVTNGNCPLAITRTWLATDACGNTNTCSQTVTVTATTSPCNPHYSINTGTDANGALLPPGTPEQTFVNAGSPVGTNAMVVIAPANYALPFWSATNGVSQWVGPNQNGIGPSGTYTNRWIFTLPCATATLIGRICTDDDGYLFLNGVNIGPVGGYGFQFSSISNSAHFVAGQNTLEIILNNGGGSTGFRAELAVDGQCCVSAKTVTCGTAWTFDVPSIATACNGFDTNPFVVTTITNGICPLVITRNWLFVNECGNSNTCSQTVTVLASPCQLGWWPGDGNGNNLAGGHAGLLQGGVGFTAGMVGQAFNFSGSGQAVEVPNTAALDITGAISIEAWIKPTFAFGNNAILNKATAGTPDGYYFDVYQSRLRFLVGNAGVLGLGIYFQSAQLIPAGQWTHVAATYDGALIKLYVNGVLDSSMAFTDPFPGPNGRPLVIGNTSLGGAGFQGAMDEVGLYGCILSSNDIAAIYAAGSSGRAKPPMLACAPDKTVACGTAWSFDPPMPASLCCTNLDIVILNTVTNGVCPLLLTRTWQATDCCGNSNLCSQTVTVADTTPPVLTCASNKTVVCGAAWSFDPPVAVDACSGTNVVLTILNTLTNGSGCTQTFTRNWVATDLCGNTNTCSQTVTVTVTGPQTPPVITGISYNAAGIHITIETLPCYTYALECKEDLLDPTWNTCQTAVGTGANHEFLDPSPLPATRFYRVRLICP